MRTLVVVDIQKDIANFTRNESDRDEEAEGFN